MLWVLIDDIHANMSQVKFFSWDDGKLFLFFDEGNNIYIADPDKARYIKLCHQMGVRPYEEAEDGK